MADQQHAAFRHVGRGEQREAHTWLRGIGVVQCALGVHDIGRCDTGAAQPAKLATSSSMRSAMI